MKTQKLKGLSLFASAGIAEFGFNQSIAEMVLSNELLDIRAKVHEFWHPNTEMVCGDITKDTVKKELISKSKKLGVNFIFATPPCQGVSLIGKNKTNDEMLDDGRNYLIFDVFELIDAINPNVVMIENVSRFLKVKFPYNEELLTIDMILEKKYGSKYNIVCKVFDAADHGVPQHRERAIMRMWKKGFKWEDPVKQAKISVKEAIGSLPSIEAGQTTNIKNHNARNHMAKHIECMKNTPTGKSAFQNEFHFPKCENSGRRLKGYAATYKRINWNDPAPTITMRNDAISSQSNVHPGRKNKDGTYSDARVLTLRELFILTSLNPDLDVPNFASDIQIRHMIGEAVPPLLIQNIIRGLKYEE